MTKTLTVAVLAALLMLLTACGGGSDSEGSNGSDSSSSPSAAASTATGKDDAEAAKAIADSMMAAQASGAGGAQLLSMNRKDADCIGAGMVEEVGTKRLQKYGMLTEDLTAGTDLASLKMSKPDAEATTDVVFSCTDVETMIQKAINKTGNIPRQVQGCVTRTLTAERLRPMFSKIFQGQQAAATKDLTAPLMACAKKAQR
jgi:hypothetical protein